MMSVGYSGQTRATTPTPAGGARRPATSRRRTSVSSGSASFTSVSITSVSIATALIGTLLGALVGAPASPAQAADYPSWDEVEAARSSTSASAAASARIDSLLDGLQQRADSAGEQAIVASATAAQAQAAEQAAATRVQTLTAELALASERAAAGKDQLGRIAAQLYRSGAADMTRVFLAAEPAAHESSPDEPQMYGADGSDTLLRQLGTASRVSEMAASLREKALGEQYLVTGLTAEARSAQNERTILADAAELARHEADSTAAAADAELHAQRAASDTLYEQLAVLRNSSASIERGYRDGVAAAASYAEHKAAAEKAAADAAANGSNGGGAPKPVPPVPVPPVPVPPVPVPPTDGGASTPPPPPPAAVVVDPAGARAYAANAVAARGWSSGQYDCLVKLWNRESGWRADAYNASSDAYGIPQAAPGSQMSSAGADWRTNAATQIEWGLGYISNRYDDPCGAWQQSEDHNWY